MRTARPRHLPVGLESARRRFEQWRRTRRGRTRIPERLWAAAVKAAGRYGFYPTARGLGLDYYSLKKRVKAAGGASLRPVTDRPDGPGGEGVAGFLELAPVSPTGFPECVLELEDPGGAKMRIHLKGMSAPDLTALSRSFWSRER